MDDVGTLNPFEGLDFDKAMAEQSARPEHIELARRAQLYREAFTNQGQRKTLKEGIGGCITAIDREEHLRRVGYALSLGLPTMAGLQDVCLGGTIAVCGSGNSISQSYSDIPSFRKIMAGNKAHDYLLSLGLRPTFGVMLDPNPWCVSYQTPQPDCIYLLAAQMHPNVFQKFREAGRVPFLWAPVYHYEDPDILDNRYPGSRLCHVAGGTTVGLRMLMVASFLGFQTIDMHGFDSCYAPALNGNPDFTTAALYAHPKPHIRHDARELTIVSKSTGDKFTCVSNQAMARQILAFQRTADEMPQYEVNGRIGQVRLRIFGDGAIPWMAWKDGGPDKYIEHAFPERMEAKYGKSKHWNYALGKDLT